LSLALLFGGEKSTDDFVFCGQKLFAGTCQYLVWKIEGKVAKFCMMTFTCLPFIYRMFSLNEGSSQQN
jgi:hypothetical protein